MPNDCVIPSQVENASEIYTVTQMNLMKFLYKDGSIREDDCGYGNYGPIPVKLTIPGTVKYISHDLFHFWGVGPLEELYIEEGELEEIGAHAFCHCDNLKKVHLPSNLKRICDFAFDTDREISEINLPKDLEEVGSYAFGQSRHYEDIFDRPSEISAQYIENSKYAEYKILNLPNSIIRIGAHAFERKNFGGLYDRNGWYNVILPTNLESIEDYTFDLEYLPELIVPNFVTKIGKGNFKTYGDYYGGDLRYLTLGMSVKDVDESAF